MFAIYLNNNKVSAFENEDDFEAIKEAYVQYYFRSEEDAPEITNITHISDDIFPVKLFSQDEIREISHELQEEVRKAKKGA
jgi:hypothetical protein